MKKQFEYKYVFLLIYFFMMLSIMLDMAGGFPFSAVLRKIKYVFIFFAILLYLRCGAKAKIKSITGLVVWFLFFLHTVLWGTIFAKAEVKMYISEHTQQMLWYLVILLLIVISVVKYNCFDEFINISYVAVSGTVLWAFFRHVGEVRHPKFWISAMGLSSNLPRWKATFGFMDANFCGYYCMTVIAVSLIIMDRWRRTGRIHLKNRKLVLIFLMDSIAGVMLLSSASRSNILATGIMIWLYIYLYPGIFLRKFGIVIRAGMNFLMCGVLITVILIGGNRIGNYIWANSNRVQNIEVNMNAFREIGSWLTGMGYVENDYFSKDIWAYDTWNIDMYYQYIFFATGILGSILIGTALILILGKLCRIFRQNGCPVFLVLYASMLFNAFWQVNFCTYRSYPSLVLMSCLLIIMCTRNNKKYEENKL